MTSRIQADGTQFGPLAILSGFRREEVQNLALDWNLALGDVTREDLYEVVLVPWSRADEDARGSSDPPTEGLSGIRMGDEDVLIGRAGVVWLEPGRSVARVSVKPDGAGDAGVAELLGAALMHAMALNGWLPLHGMAADLNGVGILAMGRTMAGKSTLAAALLQTGARLVSDDFLLVGLGPDGTRITSLRRDLRLREPSWGLVPHDLMDRFQTEALSPEHRALSRLDAPERFLSWATPHVFWYLDGLRARSIVEAWPLSQAVALSHLIEGTSSLFVGTRYRQERGRLLTVMKALVESAPSFRVRLGTELLDAPARAIDALLVKTLLVGWNFPVPGI